MDPFERVGRALRVTFQPDANRVRSRVVIVDRSTGAPLLRDELNVATASARQRCADRLDEGLRAEALALLEQGAAEIDRLKSEHASRPRQTAAEKLHAIVDELGVEVFPDEHGRPFATFPVTPPDPSQPAHRETWPLRSTRFREWLRKRYRESSGRSLNSDALAKVLEDLAADAQGVEPQPVYVRVGAGEAGLYVDLGRPDWSAVHVTAEGWRISTRPPVKFRRGRTTGELPLPRPGGSLDVLREFVPAKDEDWPLIAAFLAACMRPHGPYPVLVVQGEQGAAKSTACRIIRSLVDPSSAPLRSPPRDERDLAIHAASNWLLAIDNVSRVPTWLGDCWCRLATGGGFGTRALYSDDEEVVFTAQRPVVLNGIEELTSQGDLRDRALIVTLPRIPDERRRDERSLWAAFESARPAIFGALLDAVSCGLRRLDSVRLDSVPRMADFAEWAVACELGLGLAPGAFLDAYKSNRKRSTEDSLSDSPVAAGVRELARLGPFEGSSSKLLDRLTRGGNAALVPESERSGREWPKDARGLSNALRRLAPTLRQLGVEVEYRRTHGQRLWAIWGRDRVPQADEGADAVPHEHPTIGTLQAIGADGVMGNGAAGADEMRVPLDLFDENDEEPPF